MKKLTYLLLIGVLFTACSKDSNENSNTKKVNISMGSSYATDIYYSLESGTVATTSRTEWDIAFYTDARASTIITNDGNGVKLYVAGSIDDWDNITTIPSAAAQYNTYSDTTWQKGAFDKGMDESNVFDYGWGIYNMSSHTVIGDSVHVIELADGTAKKLIIEKREASTNSYHIKYANLDGSDEVTDIVNTNEYSNKNFIHYSITNQATVSREPASSSWDILFTKYYDEDIPYIVTGVLSNEGIQVAKLEQTAPSSNNYESANYVKVINTIGSDWKSLNHETYSYEIVNDMVYFIKDNKGKYHKLVFSLFEGTATGNIEFELTSY